MKSKFISAMRAVVLRTPPRRLRTYKGEPGEAGDGCPASISPSPPCQDAGDQPTLPAAWFVWLAIIAILLSTTLAAAGHGLPWVADFPPDDRLSRHAPETAQKSGTEPAIPFSGFTSVDFLGHVRRHLDVGRLISLFPFSWSGGAPDETAADRVKFLGFDYERVNATTMPGEYYYTGERDCGRRIYVSGPGKSSGVMPDHVYLKDDGRYVAYAISGRPAVYAYVLYGAFNAGETVRFGIANDGASPVDLPNAAPYEIRRRENGTWRTIYSAIAAQVITQLPGASRIEWQWDQRLSDGSLAPPGDCEVMIAGKYVAPFRIAWDVPVVERLEADIDRADVEALAASSPAPDAFQMAHPDQTADVKEETISIMQYKAWALGLDQEQLRKAIMSAGDGIPCMAIRATCEGRPVWIILFSSAPSASRSAVYVSDS